MGACAGTDFQGAQRQRLCLTHLWPGKDKPSLCLNSKNTIWTGSGILGHLEAAEHWMLRKDLGKWEKKWAEPSITPSMREHNESLKRGNVWKEKKAETTAVFFQCFSRKKVDICTWQKLKHHFLEWAKCHSNRQQKCRHAKEQVYELMHGHVFCPEMLKQQLLDNYFNS